jgi:hypothetical protein
MPVVMIRRVLKDFNDGILDAESAATDLGISRAQLYRYRTDYLRHRQDYRPQSSGGDRHGNWPDQILAFLKEFLPRQKPPNFQLVTDELLRLHDFKRARSSVEAYVKTHLPEFIPQPERKPRGYRRFRRAYIGELWQHDSSIHPWWPADNKQVLLLSCDDCSGLIVGGSFVASDTTWNHFLHFRRAFVMWGIPEIIYTDGLSLFGPSSASDKTDPRSAFQRALQGLDVGHRVAPTPQAKGKIERRFGTLQKRLVTLLAHARVGDWKHADEILQMEINRQNQTVSRSTGKAPMVIWQSQATESKIRLCPAPSLLDLHLSLRHSRRINADHTIDFEGQNYSIANTRCRYATILHHPNQQFWVVEGKPTSTWTRVLGHFTL